MLLELNSSSIHQHYCNVKEVSYFLSKREMETRLSNGQDCDNLFNVVSVSQVGFRSGVRRSSIRHAGTSDQQESENTGWHVKSEHLVFHFALR